MNAEDYAVMVANRRRTEFIVIGCAFVAALRFTVPGHGFSWPGSYEALAHIWCGMLIAWALRKDWAAIWGLAAITMLEGLMFAIQRSL